MHEWRLGQTAHCESCLAAAGQIHSLTDWQDAGIYPKSPLLFCQAKCDCSLVDVGNEMEAGDLDIPLRSVDVGGVALADELVCDARVTLKASGVVNESGSFEVLAITAGEGNGWNFSEEALRESLALWDGAECFVDHSWTGHSLRDLAGICSRPVWDEGAKGICVTLQAVGPSGALLAELGQQMLGEGNPKPRIGFSADIQMTSKGKSRKVDRIVKVYSLDLVFNPARGGAFKRALNSVNMGGFGMADFEESTTVEKLQKDVVAALEMARQHEYSVQLQKDAEAAKAARTQLCSVLLDTQLGGAKLPAAMAESVRKQFASRIFEVAELNDAIEDARKLVSELTGALVVQGPGRLSGMADSADRIQCAVNDLFDIPRDKGMEKVSAPKLTGIRELYLTLTGDDEMHGGFYAERVRLATTADFTGLVKNALNKIVINTWDLLGQAGYNWWEKITVQEHFTSLQGITGTLMGTVGLLPTVAEGGEYTELAIGDSPETAAFQKYGGYIPLTLELVDRDETRKLKAYPRELATAALRRISSLVAGIFTQASGVGPTMADGGVLFNATAVTTAGGHLNLLTTALAAAAWETVCTAVYNQPMMIKPVAGLYGTGPKMAINPRYLLVPRALQLTGYQTLYPKMEHTASIFSENQQMGMPGDVITVPEWTDVTDWAAVCDPRIAPAIYIGERFGLRPEIFIANNDMSPAVFMNDEHRLKVRQFVAVWVNDFRPLHKENVAG